jgi:hypothetical protein
MLCDFDLAWLEKKEKWPDIRCRRNNRIESNGQLYGHIESTEKKGKKRDGD